MIYKQKNTNLRESIDKGDLKFCIGTYDNECEKILIFNSGSLIPKTFIYDDSIIQTEKSEEQQPSPNSYIKNLTFVNGTQDSNGLKLNFDIASELIKLTIKKNSNVNNNESTYVSFHNYVKQLILESGNITIGQHTQHNFYMDLPDVSTIEKLKTGGENYIYNLEVGKLVTLDVNEKKYTDDKNNEYNKKILAIGKNHVTDASSSTKKENLVDCKFIMDGKIKKPSTNNGNKVNFDIFVGCTSYYTDFYRFALKILKKNDKGGFTINSDTNNPEEYKKHLTWFNNVNVDVSSDLFSTDKMSCTLYIGCNLLRYKEFSENEANKIEFSNFENCEDLYIKSININLTGKYKNSLLCGIISKDVVTNGQP